MPLTESQKLGNMQQRKVAESSKGGLRTEQKQPSIESPLTLSVEQATSEEGSSENALACGHPKREDRLESKRKSFRTARSLNVEEEVTTSRNIETPKQQHEGHDELSTSLHEDNLDFMLSDDSEEEFSTTSSQLHKEKVSRKLSIRSSSSDPQKDPLEEVKMSLPLTPGVLLRK